MLRATNPNKKEQITSVKNKNWEIAGTQLKWLFFSSTVGVLLLFVYFEMSHLGNWI